MPKLRIEIDAVDRIEATRVVADYQRGKRNQTLENLVEERAWDSGRTPVGRAKFVGLTNGQPPQYKFDIDVEAVAR